MEVSPLVRPNVLVQGRSSALSRNVPCNVGLSVLRWVLELVMDAPSRVVPALVRTVKFVLRAFQPSWQFES